MTQTTSKYALTYPVAADPPAGHTQIQQLAQDVEDKGLAGSSTLASRPVASAVVAGRRWYATDTDQTFVSNGSSWKEVPQVPIAQGDLGNSSVGTAQLRDDDVTAAKLDGTSKAQLALNDGTTVRRGKCVIATEESITDQSYAFMPTPDRISNLVLPTDGLIAIAYRALWKESSGGAAACLFIGANEFKQPVAGGVPVAISSAAHGGTPTNVFAPLQTSSNGLSGAGTSSSTSSTYVTTGMKLTPIYFEAAAGTYEIAVKFLVIATPGATVTVKDRKLLAWTVGF